MGRKKPPEAAAGHDTLVLRTKTLLASMAHGRTDRTSRRAEIPPPEEAALRAAPQRGVAAEGGRPPLWTPLVEESQPSGLSSPYTHAPCWLKVSLSSKLRRRPPQLPPAVLFGQKLGQGWKFVKTCPILKVLRKGFSIVENLSGLCGNIFSLFRKPQLYFGEKSQNWSNYNNFTDFPYCPCLSVQC